MVIQGQIILSQMNQQQILGKTNALITYYEQSVETQGEFFTE